MIVEDLYISASVFEIMEPLIITSRVFGLFPISCTYNGSMYRLKWSITYGLYSYLLSVGLAIAAVMGLLSDIRTDPKNALRMTDEKTRFITCGDISIVIITVVFAAVTLHSKIKKFWSLMIILNKADDIIPFKNSRIRKASQIFISVVLVTIVIIFALDIIMKSNGKNRLSYLKTYFSFYILYTIVIMIEVFYWHVIFFIKLRISLLIENMKAIRDLQREGNFSFKNMVGTQNVVDNTHRKNNRRLTGINTIIPSGLQKQKDPSELARWLLSLSSFQNRIVEAAAVVNNSVELCIHIIMLSCLLHLIVTPYFLLVEILGNGDIFFILLQVIWLLTHIGRVLIIVEPCHTCINEHEKSSNLICEILMTGVDEQVKNALTVLSLQLNYCKLNFSSCGFFKINRSLLTSIAGAVTTYLIILFQFKDT